MYSVGYNGLGQTQPSWYAKLAASNPKVATLTPWPSPKSYGDFFKEGWQLAPNLRYVTPSSDTLDYAERAVAGIRKYNEKARLWADQLPGEFREYRDAGLLFVMGPLTQAHVKAQELLQAALYNSKEVYGLPRLPWSSYVQFLGWTIHTIIKAYNLSKRYANAFKNTVKTGLLDANLATLPDLAMDSTAAAMQQQINQMDKDPAALDTLQDLGVLPAQPATDPAGVAGALPPTLPSGVDEDDQPAVPWYYWAGAALLGAAGAGGLALAFHLSKKRADEAEAMEVTPTPSTPAPPPTEPEKPVPSSVVAQHCGKKGLNRQGYSVCASRVQKGQPVRLQELKQKYPGKGARS